MFSSKTRPEINAIREQLAELGTKLEKLVDADTTPMTAEPGAVSLAGKIEELLRVRPMSLEAIVTALETPAAKVGRALRTLRGAGKVYNLGNEESSSWIWVVGDEITTPDLIKLVEQLISDRPMLHREIAAATGANPNRLRGVMVRLQVMRKEVVNLGNGKIARWFLPSPEVARRLRQRK